jgi:hypothetical protein
MRQDGDGKNIELWRATCDEFGINATMIKRGTSRI